MLRFCRNERVINMSYFIFFIPTCNVHYDYIYEYIMVVSSHQAFLKFTSFLHVLHLGMAELLNADYNANTFNFTFTFLFQYFWRRE